MTKKDFFIILIKLFGLYLFIATLFGTLPGLVSITRMEMDLEAIIYILAFTGFFVFLLIALFLNSEKVVDFLKLDKGFDSDVIQFEKIDKTQVIQLGLIIVGGLTFLEYLPSLLTNVYYFYKSLSQDSIDYGAIDFTAAGNYAYLTKDFIAVLLSYLVLTNHDKLAKKLL